MKDSSENQICEEDLSEHKEIMGLSNNPERKDFIQRNAENSNLTDSENDMIITNQTTNPQPNFRASALLGNYQKLMNQEDITKPKEVRGSERTEAETGDKDITLSQLDEGEMRNESHNIESSLQDQPNSVKEQGGNQVVQANSNPAIDQSNSNVQADVIREHKQKAGLEPQILSLNKINKESNLPISSAFLGRFMKPAPKIYKKTKIGKKKFIVLAKDRGDLETKSFYAYRSNQDFQGNLNPYHTVDFDDDETEEEEQLHVKFWTKKNMIRSVSSNPRGYAGLLGRPNIVDQIQDFSRKGEQSKSLRISRKKIGSLNNESLKANLHKSVNNPHNIMRLKGKVTNSKPKKRFKYLVNSSTKYANKGRKLYRNRSSKGKRLGRGLESFLRVNRLRQKNNSPDHEDKIDKMNLNWEEDPIANDDLDFEAEEVHEDKFTNNFRMPQRQNVKKTADKIIDIANADGITVELEENRSVCLEDMETKLCLFFKKTLVYSSKIDLLKLKIQKQNGEHTIYSIFRHFCDPESGKLSLENMINVVQRLQFPMEESTVSRIMLFLEKFISDESEEFLELEYGDFRQLFTSHKFSTPEVYLFSNWSKEISQELKIPDQEFYLLRQILMLTSREVLDISRIVNVLRSYTADSLFDYITLFAPDEPDKPSLFEPQVDLTSSRVQKQLRRPTSANLNGVIPSFRNNNMAKSFREVTIKSNVEPNYNTLKKDIRSFNVPTNKNQTISKLISPKSILNKFMRSSDLSQTKDSFEIMNNFELPKTNAPFKTKEPFKQEFIIEVTTLRNFLNFHGVLFLEEDLELLMHFMGAAAGELNRSIFHRFIYSPLWDNHFTE